MWKNRPSFFMKKNKEKRKIKETKSLGNQRKEKWNKTEFQNFTLIKKLGWGKEKKGEHSFQNFT